jgi:hypothetical protein
MNNGLVPFGAQGKMVPAVPFLLCRISVVSVDGCGWAVSGMVSALSTKKLVLVRRVAWKSEPSHWMNWLEVRIHARGFVAARQRAFDDVSL